MVICRYFQQGGCRFGNTCRNEHAYNSQYNYQSDTRQPQPQNVVTNNPQNEIAMHIRSIITDMTAAEQGKQWLLSCYGPFKGKANFPTFEDHSFEEIRWMIYNARKQGNSDAVVQLYTQMVQEAKRKFAFYQTPTRELIDTIKNIYSTTDTAKNTPQNFGNSSPVLNQANNAPGQNFTNTNSIFNQANPQPIQTNRNQSIFGGNQQQPTNAFSSGINQSFPFNSQQNNVFTTATNQSNNIFNANNQNTTNSVLGQANIKPESKNMFGTVNNAFGTTNNGNSNVFGSTNSGTVNSGSTNVFGATNNGNNGTSNVFGSTQNAINNGATNVFGSTNNTAINNGTNVFGSTNTGTTNVFGSTNNAASTNGTANVFGSTNNAASTNGTANVFGSTNNAASTNGTANVFGTTNSPLAQNTNIFSSNTPLAQNSNVFGGNQPANSPLTSNVFGSNQFNTFQTQQNSVFAQNSTKKDNIFTNNSMIPPQQNVFSTQNVVQNSNQMVNPFSNQQSVFGNPTSTINTQIKQENTVNDEIYSKIEDLSEVDIKAFKSERFEFGCIPILPPPSSLCYAS